VAGPQCPVCEWQTQSDAVQTEDAFMFDCPRCGPYIITGEVQGLVLNKLRRDSKARAIVSHMLKTRRAFPGAATRLDSNTLDHVLSSGRLPSAPEQAKNLLIWLFDNQPTVSAFVKLPIPEIGAVIGTADVGPTSPTDGLVFILNGLVDSKMIETGGPIERCRLTLTGQQRVEALKLAEADATRREEGEVSASDRVVTINHNAPAYKPTTEALAQTIETVSRNNEYRASDPDAHEQRVAELEAGAILLKAPKINVGWIKFGLMVTLKFLAVTFAGTAIGMLATDVINGLLALFHGLL